MSDKEALQLASAKVVSAALVWRAKVQEPVTRAENDLRTAVDLYIAEVSAFTGRDISRLFS